MAKELRKVDDKTPRVTHHWVSTRKNLELLFKQGDNEAAKNMDMSTPTPTPTPHPFPSSQSVAQDAALSSQMSRGNNNNMWIDPTTRSIIQRSKSTIVHNNQSNINLFITHEANHT